MPEAVIEITDSRVLPVRVQFPKNFGNYCDIEHAMVDIKLFGCKPVFKEKAAHV